MFGVSRTPADPGAVSALRDLPEPQFQFNMVIRKATGNLLGLDIVYSSAASWSRNGAVIACVKEDGMVAAWNARSEDPQRVHVGDIIFQVNEVHGDTIAMIQEIKSQQVLTIYVVRVSGPLDLADLEGLMSPPLPQRLSQPVPNGERWQPEEEQMSSRSGVSAEAGAGAEAARRFSPRVEALLPEISALSDEALASLVCVALEQRPHCNDVLREP
mmetsp:Transcript_155080/g.476366  ORF Transcript_155080/g.476366 Transcript_155080/m.476366 type:complete len:215 (-) Transcript_155080:49-693(-)